MDTEVITNPSVSLLSAVSRPYLESLETSENSEIAVFLDCARISRISLGLLVLEVCDFDVQFDIPVFLDEAELFDTSRPEIRTSGT
jgi:hypothetical protein